MQESKISFEQESQQKWISPPTRPPWIMDDEEMYASGVLPVAAAATTTSHTTNNNIGGKNGSNIIG